MPRTLEDLVNELLALDAAENRRKYDAPKQEIKPAVECAMRTESAKTDVPAGRDLPECVMQELKLPTSLGGIFKGLQQFQSANRNKPFFHASLDLVGYVENDQMLGVIRVYLGKSNSVKVRGNGGSITFQIETVFEYQFQLIDDTVSVRTRVPEDFLCSPDRAQGKTVETLIFFSVFPDGKHGVSTFSIRPEYVRSANYGSIRNRRMA